MSFRFGDPGGRMYQTPGSGSANILAHWTNTNVQAGSTLAVQAGGGRAGGTCLRLSAPTFPCSLLKGFAAQPTFGVAFAFKPAALTNTTTILAFLDGASVQCDLRLDTAGMLTVTRNGTALGTAAAAVSAGTWVHIELRITFHLTLGTVYLGINGVPRINLANQNTRNTGNASATVIQIGGLTTSATSYDFDDIIIYDDQPTDGNGFADIGAITVPNPTGTIGDCGLAWMLPDAVGNSSQFARSTGIDNYALVDETTPNNDADYVQSGTVNDIDTYSMANLPVTALTIKSLAVINYARKTDVGSRTMQAVVYSGGGNTVHATPISLSDSYLYCFSSFGRDPNNGSTIDWTAAAVNALQIGQKVIS